MDDLLYTPLWLGVEPPAMREFDLIATWALMTATEQSKALSTHLSFKSFTTTGYRCCVYSASHGGWQNNFDKVFEDVASYLKLLPTIDSELLIMMLCTNPDAESLHPEFFNTQVPHMDKDRSNALGVRYYMWHDNVPRLQWRRVSKNYEAFYSKKTANADEKGIGIEFDPKHCTEPQEAPILKGSFAWALSNVLAPHNVNVADVPNRCLLSIMGLDHAKLNDLVNKSTPLFKDYTLSLKDI